MRHFLLLPAAMTLLPLGVMAPTRPALLVALAGATDTVAPGYARAARRAVPLPPVTPAADQHHQATALAAVQTKRTELHTNSTARMTGASAAALAVAV